MLWFLWAQSQGDTTEVDTLLRFGASERGRVWDGEWWRFLTPTFMHVGWAHLFMNTIALPGWCAQVEKSLGSGKFVAVYLLTGIASSSASLLCHDVVSAGASGALFGMVGVTFVLLYRRLGTWSEFVSNGEVRRIFWLISLWMGLGFAVLPMDNYAHLGGLGFGAGFGWIFTRPPRKEASMAHALPAVLLGLLLMGTLVAAAIPWPGRKAQWGAYEAAVAAWSQKNASNPEKALKLYNKAERWGYSEIDLYLGRSIVLVELGRFGQANRDIDTALSIDAGSASSWENRAWIHSRMDHPEKAIEYYTRALELDPESANLYWGRGVVRRETGDRNGAISDFTKVIEMNPDSPEVYIERGWLLYKLDRLDEAMADCERAIEIDPDNAGAYINRALVWEGKENGERALADYSVALEKSPGNNRALLSRARYYLGRGHFTKALADYERVIELNPDNMDAWVYRASIWGRKEDWDRALTDYSLALQRFPGSHSAFMGRGWVHLSRGDYKKARADYSSALELEPKRIEAFGDRGWVSQLSGDLEGALRDYDHLLTARPDSHLIRLNRVVLYLQMNRFEDALSDLEMAIEVDPINPVLFGNRALALAQLGRHEEALCGRSTPLVLVCWGRINWGF